MQDQHLFQKLSHWNQPIGLGWDNHTVRNPSNLDDGPWHECPSQCRLHRPFLTSTCKDGESIPFESIPCLSIQRLRAARRLTVASLQPCVLSHLLLHPGEPGSGIQQVRGALEQGKELAQHSILNLSRPYPRSWFAYEGVSFKPSSSVKAARSRLRTNKKPATPKEQS